MRRSAASRTSGQPQHDRAQSAPRPYRRRQIWLLIALLALGLVIWFTGAAAYVPIALARSSMWQREHETARQWLNAALRINAADSEAQLLLARIARREGQYDTAAKHLRSAELHGVDSQRVRLEQALALAQTGQLSPDLEQLLNRWMAEATSVERREIVEAYVNGLAQQARFDDAHRLLDAWKLDFPEDPEPCYRLGRIYEHLRQRPDAEQQYRAALERDGEHHRAAYSLARVLLESRQVEEALTFYRRCLSAAPAAAQVGMGLCLKAMGDVDAARRLFQQAAEVDEQARQAAYAAVDEPADRLLAAAELGKLESEAGNFEAGERWLRKAVEHNPRDSVARYAYAVALRGLGRQAAAEEQFELVRISREALEEAGNLHDYVDEHPNDADARYRLGSIILEHDSQRMGLYWLRTALEVNPHHAPTHRALAEFYAAQADEHPGYAELAQYHRAYAEMATSKP